MNTDASMEKTKQVLVSQAVKDFGRQLLSFISRRVDNEADAEDIMQDVWYQFSATINASPVEQVGAWLYKVARNKIIDRYRKKTEESLEEEMDTEEEDEFSFREILMTDDGNPETEYLKNLFWEQLFVALNELPEEQKQVFVWHELEDFSFEEISETTGVNVKTLISRKRYAVLYLRKRLKNLYEDIVKY